MTVPTLALCHRLVVERLRLPHADLWSAVTVEACDARRRFVWLAREVAGASVPGIAAYLGRAPSAVAELLEAAEAGHARDRDIADELDQLAIEAIGEQGVRDRLDLPDEAARPPEAVAARLLASQRVAITVPIRDLQCLAAAYLALAPDAALPERPATDPRAVAQERVLSAALRLETADGGPGERGARAELNAALAALVATARRPRFSRRTTQEKARG